MSTFFRQIFSKLFNTTERRRRRSMSLGNDWSYNGENGPENWHKNFPVAAGEHQSPVNIDTHDVIYDPMLGDINFSGYHLCNKQEFFRIKNTGYTIKVDLQGEIQIKDADNKCFEAFVIQFHWGDEDDKGSEHLLDMKAFPLEIQILHRNIKYDYDEEMLYKFDGTKTLGIFAEIGEEDNEGLNYITDKLKNVKFEGQEIDVPAFPISSLLPLDTSRYYTYTGSLSTPPCNECNNWVIIKNPIKISRKQLSAFRGLMGKPETSLEQNYISNNFRPIQPLYRRTITASLKLQEGIIMEEF